MNSHAYVIVPGERDNRTTAPTYCSSLLIPLEEEWDEDRVLAEALDALAILRNSASDDKSELVADDWYLQPHDYMGLGLLPMQKADGSVGSTGRLYALWKRQQ